MKDKRNRFYDSSRDALIKLCVTILTLGISVVASFIDDKACYATIIVQAINNFYDFMRYADDNKYSNDIVRYSQVVIIFAVISIIYSFIGLLHDSAVMGNMIMKIIGIFMVSIPVLFVAGDSRIAKREENG